MRFFVFTMSTCHLKNQTLIHWIKIDNLLLLMIINDSCETAHCTYRDQQIMSKFVTPDIEWTCMFFTIKNAVLLMRQGASVVWHHSLPLMNSFNKTEAAVFSCKLCFLRAFPFISLIAIFFIIYMKFSVKQQIQLDLKQVLQP